MAFNLLFCDFHIKS